MLAIGRRYERCGEWYWSGKHVGEPACHHDEAKVRIRIESRRFKCQIG